MGEVVVARGDLWWGETPEEKGRPYLVISRDAANAAMQRVLVAPITSRVRSIPSELPVGPDDGLPFDSVATFDDMQPFPIAMLTRRLGRLDDARIALICTVAAATLDC